MRKRDMQNSQKEKMKFGIVPIEGVKYYAQALEEVQFAEELGFDSAFIQERHLVQDHFWASPLIAASAMLAGTSRIKVGTGILISPFHHPVHLAEDIAILDITSCGRFIFGTAIGYKPDEFDLYGIDPSSRGARFEESMHIVKRLWTEGKIDFHGKFYTIKTDALEPRPHTNPPPPLWIGGQGPLMLKRAALFADAWIPGVSIALDQLLPLKEAFLKHRKEAGIKIPDEWPLNREVVIAETRTGAWELAEKYLLPFYQKTYVGNWKHRYITADMVKDLQQLAKDRFIIGSPDDVVSEIRRYKDVYGTNYVICRFFFGNIPHETIMKELELFAKTVMPTFG